MLKKIIYSLLSLVFIAGVAFVIWANVVFPVDTEKLAAVHSDTRVTIQETDHSFVMTPTGKTPTKGLVFIPGAKVPAAAYLYKLSDVAANGVGIVVTKPTLNLAFFDLRSLDTFIKDIPSVTTWSLGGHSLGGVKACMLAGETKVTKLVLLGSYCANDVSKPVISIRGSNDDLTKADEVEKAKVHNKSGGHYYTIDGGNHASMGNYGEQPGDGQLTIADESVKTQLQTIIEQQLNE